MDILDSDILDKLSLDDPRFTHLDLSRIDVDAELLQKIADKLDKNTFVNRVSWRNGYYYRIDLKKMIEDKVEVNFKNFQRHPTDFIHALLSKHVYDDSEEGSSVQFSLEKNETGAETWNKELKCWRVLKVFNHLEAGRYYGCAYLNEGKKQMVLAHRGTTKDFWDFFKFDSPIKTDLDGILSGKIVKQQEKAFVATKEVIKLAKEKGWNVSFTGHSLGAWLAELSLYFAVNSFSHYQSKAVTFDSPGSASTITSFKSNVESDETDHVIKNLDITTYLSAPNFVNCCNQHIGRVYRIFPNIIPNKFGERLGKISKGRHIEPKLMGFLSVFGHSITPIIATFDPVTGKPVKFEKVLDWPHIKYQPSTTIINTKAMILKTLNSVPVLTFLPGIARWAYEVVSNYQPIQDNSTIGAVVGKALNFVPVLKLLPVIGRWAPEVVPKPTFWTCLETIDQFFSGNFSSKEFWEAYEHLEPNAASGFPIKETVLLSSEEQFNLFFVGHYCTQELNPFKDLYNPNSSDWYLHQLSKLSPQEIDRKEINDAIKTELKSFKNKYKIIREGNKKYICVSSFLYRDIQVDSLREEFVKLCERYIEIHTILEDKNTYAPENEALNQKLISNLPHFSENIVERTEVLETIGLQLNKYKCLVISAFGGTGKSTIAKEYGRYLKENFRGQIVRFIVADTSDKINDAYKSIAENELKVNVTGQEAINIMQIVHCSIANAQSSVLFIFDNVESSEDVKEYIGGIYNLGNCKVIITTRNINVADDLNLRRYELGPFTSKEAKSYIERNSTEKRFSPYEIEYLIDHLSSENLGSENCGSENVDGERFVLPFSLSHAVAYFNRNKLCTTKRYLEDLAESVDPTGTCLLLNLLDPTELSFQVLQYSAYLDPDFIGIDILKELFSIDEDTLNCVLHRLESLSLMTLKRLETGHYGLQMHRLVQHWVKKYTNAKQHPEFIDKQDICNGIIQVLSKLFPTVTQVPNEDWQLSQILYPHAVKILENDFCRQKFVEMSQLIGKLGHYNYNVVCNYAKALKYHKQALSLDQELFTNQETIADMSHNTTSKGLKYPNSPLCSDYIKGRCVNSGHTEAPHSNIAMGKQKASVSKKNHPRIARSLNNVGLTYSKLGILTEGLKYGEAALDMSRALYSENNHSDIAIALDNLSRTYSRLGETAKSLNYAKEALEIRRALYPGINHPEIAASLNNLSLTYTEIGETAEGLKYGKEALEMNRALYPRQNHPYIATSLDNLGMTYRKMGETAKGLKYVEEALKMELALYPGLNHPKIAESLNNLGLTYTKLGNAARGLKYGKEALKMAKTLYSGQNHPDIATTLDNLSMAYSKLGDTAKGLKLGEEALRMKRAFYSGQNHPKIAQSLTNLGLIYTKQGNGAKGLKYVEEGLEMNRALYPGQNHPEIAASLNNVGFTCRELGETAKGLKYVKDALEMRQALYPGQNHHDIATSLNNVGFTYRELGETTKGLKYAEEALKMSRALHSGLNNPNIATFLDNLGLTYTKNGETAKGLKYAEEALEMRRALYPGQSHPEIALSLNTVCFTYGRLGDIAKGLKYGEEALKMSRALYLGCHPDTATILNNLGLFCTKLGETIKGLKYLEEALEMRQALYPGQNHPGIVETLTNIGLFYKKLGETAKGQKYIEKASELKRAQSSEQKHP